VGTEIVAKPDAFWILCEGDEPRIRRAPKWKKSAYYCEGEIYVPAWYFGNEDRVALCAMHDGAGLVNRWHHTFVAASWAKKEFPGEAKLIEVIERKVKEHIASEGAF
jgi:hypothetical protein